jgi:2-C-methyl-D-erythritol 2,4-cyclodiphosphate synthase
VQQQGYELVNADMTIVAQTPKMAPHIDAMCTLIAQDLNAAITTINVKATTTEALGFEGRKEGISCHSVVMLRQING